MMRATAKSLAKHSIRICAIAPSPLDGSLTDGLYEDLADMKIKGQLSENFEHIIKAKQSRSHIT